MKTFILFLKRLFGIANAATLKAIAESDKNIDIEAHANVLIGNEKECRNNIINSRNELIYQQKSLQKSLEKLEERYNNIVSIIIADSKKPEEEKSSYYKQQVKTAAHEGPFIIQSIELTKENLQFIEKSLETIVQNLGTVDRNILTITHKLELLKSRNTIAAIKNQTYTRIKADEYFNLDKLEEIVDTKEIQASTNESIYVLDNDSVDFQTDNTQDFINKILKENTEIK